MLHTCPAAHGREASHCAHGPMQPWQTPLVHVWPVGHTIVAPHWPGQLAEPGVQAWHTPVALQVSPWGQGRLASHCTMQLVVPLLQPWQVPVVGSQTWPVGQSTFASQRLGQPMPPTVQDWHRPLAEHVWPCGHGLVAEQSEAVVQQMMGFKGRR